MGDAVTVTGAGWRELLAGRHVGTAIVLAGGVALYATNEFLTISLLPSAVAEIGGQRFYAWVATVYLVGSVVAATMVGPLLARCGPRVSYLLALAAFATASVGCAVAPTMGVLLLARTAQGVAGGLLAGLGYAVIASALPSRLWSRASALVSAMWGVGTVFGPAAGGLFAQFGAWRWAFGFLAVMAAATAALVPRALGPRVGARGGPATAGIPVWSLALLGAAALTASVAAVQRTALATALLLAAGAGLLVGFLVIDRRARAAVLPRAAFRPGPLKWMYATIGLLMAATMVDIYVPLYGQRLWHLVPVAAGFLGAALSVGWTLSEIVSASVTRPRVVVGLVRAAPLVMAVALAVGVWSGVAVWLVVLLGAGAGVGMAWPHLSAWIMGAVDDGAQAGAAINTVQLISGAFGAGLAGVAVNLSGGNPSSARWLFAVFALVAVLGAVASQGCRGGCP